MNELIHGNRKASTRYVPALLSFLAGYVDSYSFIALFGLFVANVTGSFVIAGAEIVKGDPGWIGKLMAISSFFLAAFLTAAFIAYARQCGWSVMMWTLGLETLLLAAFAALILVGPQLTDPDAWRGIAAGLFGAMAMGAQSAVVRLIMRGVPQTNVMTGNLTELGVQMTEFVLAKHRLARDPDDNESRGHCADAREQLSRLLYVIMGFLIGTAVGPATYLVFGLRGVVGPIVVVGALSFWALRIYDDVRN
ncbi:MAG: YoaK family protein [Xanthobacteraceae bacterium]